MSFEKADLDRLGNVLATGTEADLADLFNLWPLWAREAQKAPAGDWTTWLLIGGRGAGKTRAGAEWIRSLATGETPVSPIALVGETITEARAVMVEGESGLMRLGDTDDRPRLDRSRNILVWPNGARAEILPGDDPERFRGPQFAAAWSDEVAKWPNAEAAWDMLQFALRLGERPRQLATTTPRPTRLIKRLLADPKTIVTRMRTEENKRNLAPTFLDHVVGRYRGTALGRQELDGELIEDRPDALWQRRQLEAARISLVPELERIVIAVDPPVTGNAKSDACGIIVAGRAGEGAVVLADLTLRPAKPLQWAARVARAFADYEADAVVAEVNQGGDLVAELIHQVDPNLPVRTVRATRGKWLRAEPVAALYARGLVRHAQGLEALEDEMCAFGPDGRSDGHSPDRVDALVWGVTELMLGGAVPRVRGW